MVVVLEDPFVAQSQPPWYPLLVLHCIIVDPVGWERLHDAHVVHDCLTSRLAIQLLIVLNHSVFTRMGGKNSVIRGQDPAGRDISELHQPPKNLHGAINSGKTVCPEVTFLSSAQLKSLELSTWFKNACFPSEDLHDLCLGLLLSEIRSAPRLEVQLLAGNNNPGEEEGAVGSGHEGMSWLNTQVPLLVFFI